MSYHVSIADTVRNAADAHPRRRAGGEARGRPQARADDRGDRRRRDPGDGPPRPHAAVGARDGRVQGAGHASAEAARALVDDAKALADAGCFAIVLEGVPDAVARMVTDAVDVPTIGIGAGRRTATARCSCSTTCSASRTASRRSSCAATPRSKADGVAAVADLRRRRARRAVPDRRRELPPVRRRRRGARAVRCGALTAP